MVTYRTLPVGVVLLCILFFPATAVSEVGESLRGVRFEMDGPRPEALQKKPAEGVTEEEFYKCSHSINEGFCQAKAPFLAVFTVARKTYQRPEMMNEDISWVPSEMVADGVNANTEIDMLEKSGAFDCKSKGCSWILRSDEPGQEETRFLCYAKVGKSMPDSCEPVQARLGHDIYLAAITGWTRIYPPPPPRYSPSDFDLNVLLSGWPHKEDELSNAVRVALTDPRLSLTNDEDRNWNFEYSCTARKSIINRDFETMTVDVNAFEWTDYETRREYEGIRYNVMLWVSSQNTDRPVDWHKPSGDDLKRVKDEAQRNLKSRLNGLCPRGKWSGSVLVCSD